MAKFADYPAAQHPAPSDILLIDNAAGTSTRKLSIAHLLGRGTAGALPKFSREAGLSDSRLKEQVAPGKAPFLLYNLNAPIMTGGTTFHAETFNIPATVSINGSLAARATNAEFSFENNWHNQNTVSIRNTYDGSGSFSTLRTLERDGWEMGSFGYGNTAATPEETARYPWYESIYIETGNPNPKLFMKDVDGQAFPKYAPSPLRFIQSGVIPRGFSGNRHFFYVRQEFVPNGDVHFYDVSAPFEQRVPVLKIRWDGQLQVSPKLNDDAVTIRNRANAGPCTMKFLTSAGRDAGIIGCANVGTLLEPREAFFIGTSARDGVTAPLLFLQRGANNESDRTRLEITSDGRILQSVLQSAPADGALTSQQMCFYLDEAAHALMVKWRDGRDAVHTGRVATAGNAR